MNDPKQQQRQPETGMVGLWYYALGLLHIALCVVGVGSAFIALVAIGRQEFVGAGTCAVASALSFGLLLNALVRQ